MASVALVVFMDNDLECLSYDAIADFSEFHIHAFSIYSTSPAGHPGLC